MRTFRARMYAIIAVVGLIVFVLAGCSKDASDSPANTNGSPSGSDTKSKIKLKLVGQGYSNLTKIPGFEDRTANVGDYLRLIADEYTKLNPHVTFDVLPLNAADGTTQQLDVEIASGKLPNVLFDSEGRSAKYRGMGLTAALDNYLSADERSDFIAGSLPERDLWRIPVYTTPKVMAINKTLFEKAGLANLLPDPSVRKWTTDEYVKALKAINSPPNVYSTILFAKTQSAAESIMGYLWPFGAQMFNSPDFSKAALNSPEGVKGAEFIVSLLDQGLAVPAPAALTDDDMWALFEKQQLAIAPEVPVFESMGKEKGFEVYYVAYPAPADKKSSPMGVFTDNLIVFENKDPKVVEESAKFAKYVSEQWGPILAAARNSFPLRKSQMDKMNLSAEQQAVYKLMSQEGIMNIGQGLSQYADIRELYKNMNQALFTKHQTPEEALKWFEAEVNKILTR